MPPKRRKLENRAANQEDVALPAYLPNSTAGMLACAECIENCQR